MVSYESGFPMNQPPVGPRRSTQLTETKPNEGPPYGADECFTDFDNLDKAHSGTFCKGSDVYMNIDEIWYFVSKWDMGSRTVYVNDKGFTIVGPDSRFIVTSKERHLTKVR